MNNLYEKLYWEMCRDCPNARRCHERCEECDEFQEELEIMEKENNGEH